MKKWICILIDKITFGKVCLSWCEIEPAKIEEKPVILAPKDEEIDESAFSQAERLIYEKIMKQQLEDEAGLFEYN